MEVEVLTEMGFSPLLVTTVKLRMLQGLRQFSLPDKIVFDAGVVRCVLDFDCDQQTKELVLDQYEAMLQQELDLRHHATTEIDSRELQARMRAINWNGKEFTKAYMLEYGNLDHALEKRIAGILRDLQLLSTAGEQGSVLTEQLQLIYWFDTSFNRDYLGTCDMDALSRKYFPVLAFSKNTGLPTVSQAFEQLVRTPAPATPLAKRSSRSARKTEKGRPKG